MHPFIPIWRWEVPSYTLLLTCGGALSFLLLRIVTIRWCLSYGQYHWVWWCMLIAFVVAARIAGMMMIEGAGADQDTLIGGETSIVGVVSVFALCVVAGRHLCPQFRFDALIPSLLLLHFVGKLACALAGCCYGALTTIPVSIPSEWSLSPLKGARIHPLQFEEAIAFFALLILSLVEVKRRCAPGKLVSLYFVGVGIERFLSIILRGDLRHTEQIIFQVFAFCTIIVGIVLSFGTPSTARITKTKHR